jgi:hypothetical protein
MLGWKLDIQESERLVEKGILCMVRKSDGSKLYVRIDKREGFDNIALIPLTKSEMKEFSIQESDQTINSEFWDIIVEESDQRTPAQIATDEAYERAKKTTTFNQNSIEDMKKAEEIAKHAREVLEGKTPYDKEVADNVRKTISDKYIALGHSPPSLETKEDIESAIEILKSFEEKERRITRLEDQIPTPSGSAPLNNQQIYGKIPEQSFESTKEMIDFLRKNPSAENEAILKKLFQKAIQGMKERNSVELPFEIANPKTKESDDSNAKAIEVSILAPKDASQESELEKFGIGKKKKRPMIECDN